MNEVIPPIGERFRNLNQHVYDVIVAAILDGRIRPSQRLVLDDLAAQLRVSQTPVRDALSRLATEGLVEVVGRRGFRVTVISPDDLIHLYDLRLMCELYAVDKGLGNLTPEVMDQIEQLGEESARPSDSSDSSDILSFVRKDREFHCLIVGLAHNPRLTDLFVRLNTHVQVTRAHFQMRR